MQARIKEQRKYYELSILGTESYQDTQMCASDHYGIVAELEFGK